MKFRSLQSKPAWRRHLPPAMRRESLLALALAAGLSAPAMAQQQPVPVPAAPAPINAVPAGAQTMNLDPKTVLILVRSTLIALDQANKTGNYSVLRDLGSPDFQRENSDARLAEVFASQRKADLDLAAALVLDPTITLAPQIEKNGLLHLAGFFPVNTNTKLTFELLFQGVDKRLLLYGLSVNIAQAGGANAAQVPAPTPAMPVTAVPGASAPAAAQDAKPEAKPEAKPKPKPRPKPKPKPKPEPEPAPIQ